jgi:hypothetical protein
MPRKETAHRKNRHKTKPWVLPASHPTETAILVKECVILYGDRMYADYPSSLSSLLPSLLSPFLPPLPPSFILLHARKPCLPSPPIFDMLAFKSTNLMPHAKSTTQPVVLGRGRGGG